MKDHFVSPQNIGMLENPDGYANIQEDCGDEIKLGFTVNKRNKFIVEDVKAQITGCLYITACVSFITEKMKGNHLATAWEISIEEIVTALQLPTDKVHCAHLALTTARTAVTDYMRQKSLTFHDLQISLSEVKNP